MNYYEILGVGDKATADEIKRAYRKLASQHHPDKGGDKNKFQEIEQAYRTLSDDSKRQQYDMQCNGFGGPGGMQFHWHSNDMNHPDISEIFRSFGFGPGQDPFGQFRQQQRRNKDLRVNLPISLASTLEEQTKTISVQTTNGQRETVDVKIPRGITNGTNIKYTCLGDNLFNTLPRGDLYVQIGVIENENFVISGLDLFTQVNVNCLLAITGGPVLVTGVDDRVFEINLPAGVQSGAKFRIPGQGVYQLNSELRGNLYVEVALTVPQNLTDEQIEIVRSLINNQ
jgi:curved DNA-binding protein